MIVFLIFLLALLTVWRRHFNPVEGQERSSLEVKSASFSDGGFIPQKYTCEDADLSPDVQWTAAPAGTRSIALVMHDPDAPADFTHWIVYNMEASTRELAEGASLRAEMPQGSSEGSNSYGKTGYAGPCPPAGKPHHYVFRIYALDRRLVLPEGATRRQLEAAMKGHVVAEGQMIGIYRNGGQ
jgi:hypothetical protein